MTKPPPTTPTGEEPEDAEDRRWVENWRAGEILHGRIEELERRLRRRTIALGTALAVSGPIAVAAVLGHAVILLRDEEPLCVFTGSAAREEHDFAAPWRG